MPPTPHLPTRSQFGEFELDAAVGEPRCDGTGETESSVSGRRVALFTKQVTGAIWSPSPAP